MERCIRCRVGGNEKRLFDAVYCGMMSSICERCAIIENVPVIKKPDISQLRESEKITGVYDRMKRMSGIKEERKEETFFLEDRLNELKKNPELELPEKNKLNLVEHFHWEIMKNRRRKGLSKEHLAEAIGESESAIEMIEKARLPENAESIIRKLEQFFQVRLRKISEIEQIMGSKRKIEEPLLLDKQGKKLEEIPEQSVADKDFELDEDVLLDEEFVELEKYDGKVEDTELKPEEVEDINLKLDEETKEINLRHIDINKVKIADLRDIHRRKIEATKQEKIEEQKKIEERQRLIEARKEESRLRRERESNEIDNLLGGSELLGEDSAGGELDDK